MRNGKRWLGVALLLAVAGCSRTVGKVDSSSSIHLKATFPRIAGTNTGAKNYDEEAYQRDIAKLDLVVLGFYRGWSNNGQTVKDVVAALKSRNPGILVGQYTIMNEADVNPEGANQDIYDKLNASSWWLLNGAGEKVQWTSKYNNWEVNFTQYALPDSNGNRYPQWLAKRNFDLFFGPVPELDIWYFDNVWHKPRVDADFNLDKVNESRDDLTVQLAYRQGMRAEWEAARSLRPEMLFMGNVDNDLSDDEYKGQLGAAFIEAGMREDGSSTWTTLMERYRSLLANTTAPHLVVLNVHGAKTNYIFARYGLTTCLMDDGYFNYTDTDPSNDGSSVPWFDEFDAALGEAVDPPQVTAWQSGVYRRRFENGVALVNPKGNGTKSVTLGESGYRRIMGTQDPVVNSGESVAGDTKITLNEREGIVLVK